MASNLKKKKLAGAVEMQMYFKLKIKKKTKNEIENITNLYDV